MKKIVIILFLLPLAISAQNTFEEAEAYFKKEQFNKAKPLFQQYLKQHPHHKKTQEYLGDIAGYTKDWDTAEKYYQPLVEAEPANANYHFKYGGVLGMKALENKLKGVTLIDDIKHHFHKAAALDANHIDVRWALVEFYIQLPGIFGGSENKALQYAEELQDISPVDGYLSKGYIAEYSDRPKDAEAYYKKAIAIGGSPHTYEKLTELYEKNNQPKEAMETASKSLKKHNRNRLNYQIGKISAQYNMETALGIESLHRYIDNHSIRDGVPKAWAYYRLAQIYRHKGEKQEALKWINKALADLPDFDEAEDEKEEIIAM
jgi:tetratricopeptide (TPR) repeat protein